MNRQRLILLDFDGTITLRDTFPQFVVFSKGMIPMLIAFARNPISVLRFLLDKKKGGDLKERILCTLYNGQTKRALFEKGEQFVNHLFSTAQFREDMLQFIEDEKENGSELCIVSASPEIWIKPMAARLGIKAICTELEFKNELFTGKFAGGNCNFEEKKKRVLEKYDLSSFTEVWSYGNSSGDDALFSLATKKVRY